MGEVDEPHDAEDQRDAERTKGVEAAEAQRVEQDLEQRRHLNALHIRNRPGAARRP